MGLYRLFLAMLVALSHAGISVYGYNPGVVAVISFFILSGYVMSILIDKYYQQASAIPTFYLDRAARLFPQFLFYMLVASACIYFLNIDSHYVKQLTFWKWLLNFLILPQAFFMYWADGALVIPQTWSLGLEMTFYLIIPWVLVYCSTGQIYGLAGASFLVFLAAYCGVINSDYFGYRLILGTFFMFLVGWSFFKNDHGSKKFKVIIFLTASVLLLITFFNSFLYQLPYNKEVLLGLIAGILAITAIKYFKFSALDEFFGNLSYGVFLNHFIIIWIMQKYLKIQAFDAPNIALLLTASCTLALVSFFYIELPALKWRHAIRNKAIHKKYQS